jgi:serine protease Do
MKKFIQTSAIALIITAAYVGLVFSQTRAQTSPTTANSPTQPLPQLEDIPSIVDRVNPGVVSIIGTHNIQILDPFSGQVINRTQTLGGSGFLVSSDGMIVTNKHVIDIANTIYKAYTISGTEYPIRIIDQDPVLDVAVIKIDGTFPYLNFADSDHARVGQTAIAIGNALGEFRNSVSVGVVSGLSRSVTAGDTSGQIEQLDELIQTDAAINPGNSGGPLVDRNGNVVGVNVATAQAESISFAIPANAVKQAVDSVRINGKIVRPYIGVRYVLVNPALQQALNLPVDYGALVSAGSGSNEPAIVSGSPADKAGLKTNDVITDVDGTSLKNRSLSSILRSKKPGDSIKITFLRNGQTMTTTAVLASL